MIIDFHTHAFPAKLAERTLNVLKAKINIEPNTDGTPAGLEKQMKLWGVDLSVVCNIATNPRQQTNVNNFAIETKLSHPTLCPLGSINPDSENIESDLEIIHEAGIPGIKIHPDYMGHELNSKKFDPIYEICSSLGLFVITHAGFDVCSPEHIHATPDMILDIITRHPKLNLVAAHFGSNMMFGEVLEKLCGKRVWIDTSLAYVENTDNTVLKKILLKHDSERIVFGSDAPWCPPDENVRFIESFGLGTALNEKIFAGNAKRLLNLD